MSSHLNCDQTPGNLCWKDIPDPAGARKVNTRAIVTIDNERMLPRLLSTVGYDFTIERIQECYRFIFGNVVFLMSRDLGLPSPATQQNGAHPSISDQLPAFESLQPFDGQGKWILTASIEVVNGNDPELMSKAIDELMEIKTEFDGCFDFQVVDRHILDTRVK